MTLYDIFTQNFQPTTPDTLRKTGIEVELPIVTLAGHAAPFETIQKMYVFLEENGWKIKKENGYVAEASRTVSTYFAGYQTETITTDLGYCTLEIIIPPYESLFQIQNSLDGLLNFLTPFFLKEGCLILGYGIQPLTPPSQQLLTPKSRYKGLEKIWESHRHVPKRRGKDAHLLTISAGNQCHIDVSREEAVLAAQILNYSSGLQIALQANSPIWKGKIEGSSKAIRETIYDYLYPSHVYRHGVAPSTESWATYLGHLADLPLFFVKRAGELIQLNNTTFSEFLAQKQGTIGQKINGEQIKVFPQLEDIHDHNSLCYFNARLVPSYGTVEVRMACQQPPGETLVTAALNLGLIENMAEAQYFFKQYPYEIWRNLRQEALKNTFNSKIQNGSILPFLEDLLMLAQTGLQNRAIGEEVFLEPLFERLNVRQSPADKAIVSWQQGGIKAFSQQFAFPLANNQMDSPTHLSSILSRP